MTACVNSRVCAKTRDCECAKPYMCVHKKKKNKFVLFFPYLSTSERGFWNCRALSKQRWPREAGEGQGPEKEGATEKAAGNIERVVSP